MKDNSVLIKEFKDVKKHHRLGARIKARLIAMVRIIKGKPVIYGCRLMVDKPIWVKKNEDVAIIHSKIDGSKKAWCAIEIK